MQLVPYSTEQNYLVLARIKFLSENRQKNKFSAWLSVTWIFWLKNVPAFFNILCIFITVYPLFTSYASTGR